MSVIGTLRIFYYKVILLDLHVLLTSGTLRSLCRTYERYTRALTSHIREALLGSHVLLYGSILMSYIRMVLLDPHLLLQDSTFGSLPETGGTKLFQSRPVPHPALNYFLVPSRPVAVFIAESRLVPCSAKNSNIIWINYRF
jgi:hypothetical protein